jgi:hypothetical protein
MHETHKSAKEAAAQVISKYKQMPCVMPYVGMLAGLAGAFLQDLQAARCY